MGEGERATSPWSRFEIEAPDIAAGARELFDRYELVVLATNRSSGFARLSLVEPVLLDGDLLVGTRDTDVKTRDLRRDARCAIHALVRHRTHDEAEFKANLVATELDGERLDAAAEALVRPDMNWRPTAVFVLDLVNASLTRSAGQDIWPRRRGR